MNKLPFIVFINLHKQNKSKITIVVNNIYLNTFILMGNH